MKFSKLFTLNPTDLIHGLYVAVGGAVCGLLITRFTAGIFTIDWPTIWHTSLAASVSFLNLRFFSGVPKSVEIDPDKTEIINKPL